MPPELPSNEGSDAIVTVAPPTPAWASLRRIALMATTVLLISGCGTGTYKQRAATRLDELKAKTDFLGMLERKPYEISDAQAVMLGVELQLPKGFESDGKPRRTGYTDKNRQGDYVIPETRVQPPFMQFRDFCLSYERFHPTFPVTWKNRELPVYCYFAVTRVNTPDGEKIEQQEILDEIRQEVIKAFGSDAPAGGADEADTGDEESAEGDEESSSGPFAWKTRKLPTPARTTIEWKQLRVRGQQFFDATAIGGENRLHDGLFDVYVHSDDTYHTVVAFRAPVNIDDQIHLMEAGPVCVGTLTVNPPPPPEGSEVAGEAGEGSSDDAGSDTAG